MKKDAFKGAMSPTNRTSHSTAGEIYVEDKPIGELNKAKVDFLKISYINLVDRQSALLEKRGKCGYSERQVPFGGGMSELEKIDNQLSDIVKKKDEIYNEIKSLRRSEKDIPKIFQ